MWHFMLQWWRKEEKELHIKKKGSNHKKWMEKWQITQTAIFRFTSCKKKRKREERVVETKKKERKKIPLELYVHVNSATYVPFEAFVTLAYLHCSLTISSLFFFCLQLPFSHTHDKLCVCVSLMSHSDKSPIAATIILYYDWKSLLIACTWVSILFRVNFNAVRTYKCTIYAYFIVSSPTEWRDFFSHYFKYLNNFMSFFFFSFNSILFLFLPFLIATFIQTSYQMRIMHAIALWNYFVRRHGMKYKKEKFIHFELF